MKTKDITHPKLYIDFKYTDSGIEFFYYSNQLHVSGKRIIESSLNAHLDSFSKKKLNQLNEDEYKKLLMYILRQEKVMNTYLKKGLNDKYQIVKNSLSLMYDFKYEFENIMINHNDS